MSKSEATFYVVMERIDSSQANAPCDMQNIPPSSLAVGNFTDIVIQSSQIKVQVFILSKAFQGFPRGRGETTWQVGGLSLKKPVGMVLIISEGGAAPF